MQIMLVSGSARSGSTNTAALRTAADVAPDGVATVLYEGLAELPLFNPDDDLEGAPVAASVAAMRAAMADRSAARWSQATGSSRTRPRARRSRSRSADSSPTPAPARMAYGRKVNWQLP
jgi:hypothetical protein